LEEIFVKLTGHNYRKSGNYYTYLTTFNWYFVSGQMEEDLNLWCSLSYQISRGFRSVD